MLCRKIRKVGSSFVITIPSQIVDMYNLKQDDQFTFILKRDEICLKKKIKNH